MIECGSVIAAFASVYNLQCSIMNASNMSVMPGTEGVRQIDPKLQKLRKHKQERKEGIALLRDMLKIKEERLEEMEKFTRHVQLSSLLDKLERNSNKRKNKSKSNNTEDGELKTRIRELEKENKQLRASEKSRAEKMKRVEAIFVATLREKENLVKDSVQLELVKYKLEGAEKKVAELTRRNERLEKENKKLLERRCQYCPKDNDILSSNVSLKSLASQTGLTEHVVGTLKEERIPGKNKRKAAMLKSVAEERARQEEETARNDGDRILDEILHSAQAEVHMELDNFDTKEEDDLHTEQEEAFKNKIVEQILTDENGKGDDASKRITSSGHSCHICGKSFGRAKTLQRHTLVHSPDKPHKCDHCGKTFRRLDALKSHKLGTERAGKCIASQRATRALGKKTKQETGNGEKRNMGEVLNDVLDEDARTVSDRSTTNAALTKCASLPVVPFSGLGEKAGNSLNKNMNKEIWSGDILLDIKKEEKRLIEKVRELDDEDDENNDAFQPSTPQQHNEIPAVVKPTTGEQSCNVCNGSFRQLKQHMYIHSKPHKCDQCGRGFPRRDALVAHQQGHGKWMTGCLVKSTGKQVNATKTEILHSQSDTGGSPVRETVSEDAIKEETIVVTVHLGDTLDARE